MNITWYGTATIEINDGKTKLLFDPFVRQNKKITTTPVEGFSGADAILITHGHYDHLYHVPELMKVDKKVSVYCTKTPAETLKKRDVSADRINVIAPNDKIKIGDFTVTVFRGKHIVFDPVYILSVVPKCAFSLPQGIRTFWRHSKMPMNNEIVMYDIENAGKHIFLTGSFGGFFPEDNYPKNPDVFILANGGSVFVPEISKKFIDFLNPKEIFVDHFDDAFPPVTRDVDVSRLEKTVHKYHPDMKFVIPHECEPVLV